MSEGAHASVSLLRDGVILLGFALVFVLLFRRLGLGATLGYLVAGALVGPQCSASSTAPRRCSEIAEIGIVLLLFLVGLELNPARLWRMKHDIFGFGLLQVVLCGLAALGAGLARHRLLARRGAGARAAAGAVVDRAGAADAAVGRAAAHSVRRARLLDPALPGPLDRPADHHHRRDVAQPGRRRRPARLAARRSTRSAPSSA